MHPHRRAALALWDRANAVERQDGQAGRSGMSKQARRSRRCSYRLNVRSFFVFGLHLQPLYQSNPKLGSNYGKRAALERKISKLGIIEVRPYGKTKSGTN